jgi:hypothetical protein
MNDILSIPFTRSSVNVANPHSLGGYVLKNAIFPILLFSAICLSPFFSVIIIASFQADLQPDQVFVLAFACHLKTRIPENRTI